MNFRSLLLLPLMFLACLSAVAAADKAKVIFISGKPSHGPGAHEHRAGNLLLAKRLNEANLGIEAIVLPENGYPADPRILEGAATIVVFCTGHRGHLLNPKLEDFDALMKQGTGVVMIHWATEAQMGPPAKMFLEWMGGYCGLNWSVNPHWKPNFTQFPDHPVSRGITPFALDDEWYYHMRFVPELKGITPILSAVPPLETLKRPDGERSGNPHVRKAVAAGESQHVAWTYDRPDGTGRGFGFTGAHNHSSWKNDNFRRVVLNAIAWTAHVEVPKDGVPSSTPSDEELKLNLDDKTQKKKPATKPKPKPAPPVKAEVRVPSLDEARAGNVKQIEQGAALAMLAKTLRKNNDPKVQKALLRGAFLGLEGQRDVPPPAGWTALRTRFEKSKDPELKDLATRLSQVFGDQGAAAEALATLRDNKADLEARRTAMASLVTQKNEALLPALEELLKHDQLRIPAIRAYSGFDAPNAANLLLAKYHEFDPASQQAVVETLATRKEYAETLFEALDKNVVPKAAIPAYVSRNLEKLLGKKFTDKYGIRKLPGDKEQQIAKYKKLVSEKGLDSRDAGKGRVIYERSCMACHQMYGAGGVVGPDLTGSNRADLDYLLLNLLDPSGDIADAYKLVTVTTKSGEILAGRIAQEDDRRIVLSMVGHESTVLKSDIKARDTSPVSMMPEGLLQILSEDETLDLFKYLQTRQQVDLPK